jgi:hypothetical protein
VRACDGGAEPPGPQEEMVRIALTSTSVFSAAVFGEQEAVAVMMRGVGERTRSSADRPGLFFLMSTSALPAEATRRVRERPTRRSAPLSTRRPSFHSCHSLAHI